MTTGVAGLVSEPVEAEDDVALFFWLLGELERHEAALPDEGEPGTDAQEHRRQGLRAATRAVAARLEEA